MSNFDTAIETMADVVINYVKSHRSDFFDNDQPRLEEAITTDVFYWAVNPDGTQLIQVYQNGFPVDNYQLFLAVKDNYPKAHWYKITCFDCELADPDLFGPRIYTLSRSANVKAPTGNARRY